MFDAYIAFHARVRPAAPAIVTPDAQVGFARLDADVDRFAGWLGAAPVGADEAVAIDLADDYLRWVILLALARRGIASAGAAEPARVRIGDGATATLRLDPVAAAAILRCPRPALPPHAHDPEALGRIMRSSGTTGAAKPVGVSWRLIDWSLRNCMIAYGSPQGPWAMLTGMDSILGYLLTLTAWAGGNAVVLGIGQSITPLLAVQLRPALVALVPDQLRRWAEATPPDERPPPVRIVSGGGPVAPALVASVRARLTDDLISTYGATETGGVATAGADLLAARPGAAGYALPFTRIEIVDDNGHPQPPGTRGLLRIRNPRTGAGYRGGGTAGTSRFTDGWFIPGDLARIEPDGLLVIEGRVDEVMNIGGHKLLPGWIEGIALACPGIVDAAAFALPGPDGAAECWLAIVPAADFDQAALTSALAEPLAMLATLRWIAVEAIPRNPMGKIRRAALREAALARFGAAG